MGRVGAPPQTLRARDEGDVYKRQLFAQYGDLDPAIAEAVGAKVRRLDVVVAAEAADLPDELLRIVTLLPPGDYTRQRLCTQLNSAIVGHSWGQVYGTVE